MDASTLETPAELISIEQESIDRQPPETRHLWLVVMAFVQHLLASIDQLRLTIGTLNQTIFSAGC